ncbi:MAG: 16S rRNA (cytidine(1402)-2'-O)-methyltransferase, partial [Ignavibacteriales bacterium]|nr:16S rRNA (cytidine(1402)-2'-O)-methyltransferase [Ignavibacteriales bacterium]
MPGILYLVATPIGNLEDMTFRALRVLKEVDIVVYEERKEGARLL